MYFKGKKRLNPRTRKFFVKGTKRRDGYLFDHYELGIVRKKTGYFKEHWRSPESFEFRRIYKRKHDKKRKKIVRLYINGIVNEKKISKGCKHCGYNKSPYALDFHHKNPSKKTVNISQMRRDTYKRLEKIKEEWKKCDVLCANCHRVESRESLYARN